jgi:hypothetical protein
MARKKKKQIKSAQVILLANHPNAPEQNEIEAAWVLARHFQCTVEFLTPIDDYLRKTADIIMLGSQWEIKCPVGASKYTIQKQFKRASKQANSVIIDSRHTKLKYKHIERDVIFEFNKRTSIKRVIIINKFGKIVEIQK